MKVLRGAAAGRLIARGFILLLVLCATTAPFAQAQKIGFRQAIDLALKHSAGMGMALADQVKAHQGFLEARNAFVPNMIFGSGVGKTWGYPMAIEGSAPSLFNLTSQSFLVNFAQRDFMRAARADWSASSMTLDDQRAATILETSLTYIQLDQITAKLAVLQRQATEAANAERVSRERLQEGVDSRVDLARASLAAARVRMRIAEAQGNADLLRQRLAQLTGLDPRELTTDYTTIPPMPEFKAQDDLATRAAQNSPAVKAADEKARAREQRARGEHRQLYPAVDLVANYGLFTKYNNLDLLFPAGRFSRNNTTAGIDIRFNFLNAAQRSRAAAADADAVRARSEAKAARDQISNDTLKLQRTVDQLTAARDVARLEYELALADIDAVVAKTQNGTATIKDQETARSAAGEKQTALFDVQFELDRARLQLLRMTGDLEGWALP